MAKNLLLIIILTLLLISMYGCSNQDNLINTNSQSATKTTDDVLEPNYKPTKFRIIWWNKEGDKIGYSPWTYDRNEIDRWISADPTLFKDYTVDSQ